VKLLVGVFIGLGSAFSGWCFGYMKGVRYELNLPQGSPDPYFYAREFGLIGASIGFLAGLVFIRFVLSRIWRPAKPIQKKTQPNPPPIAHP